MKTIWRFELNLSIHQNIRMRKKAEVLTVQIQNDILCLWALVDSEAKEELRTFGVWGTGHEIPKDWKLKFISTVQDGILVWHIFEVFTS